MAQWDQPGTAKSFGRAGNRIDPGLTHKSKLILLGWSWGSVVGSKWRAGDPISLPRTSVPDRL